MILEPGDPMPPLSKFPKEVQETVVKILISGAKRKLEYEQGLKKAE